MKTHKALKTVTRVFCVLCGLYVLILVGSQSVIAQTDTSVFPVVESHEIIGIDVDSLSISNNGDYIYTCDTYSFICRIWSKTTQSWVLSLGKGGYHKSWSFDNTQ